MEQIILYGNGCPKCRVLEAKLKHKCIEYKHITDMDIMIEKGFMSMPMLEIGGVAMNFTQANTWINERN